MRKEQSCGHLDLLKRTGVVHEKNKLTKSALVNQITKTIFLKSFQNYTQKSQDIYL